MSKIYLCEGVAMKVMFNIAAYCGYYTCSTFHFSLQHLVESWLGTVMSGIKARKWLNKKPFQGLPKKDDFEIVEEELPAMKDGGSQDMQNMMPYFMIIIFTEFIVEAQFITVDPYLRCYIQLDL